MIDAIKKTLLAGVGAAVITKEKVEDALGDYVRQGKIKADDARIIAEKIADQGRKEFDDLSQTLGGKLKDLVARADSDTASRVAALEARIHVLETKLAEPPSRSSEP
jgi:polyhydroxyalkanoate synthesis regulator phasin